MPTDALIPEPVILDTDIGGDIDDTWALALLLQSPELDIRLITSATRDTEYRARLVCRLLDVAGRTDIPVGVGLRQSSDGPRERQAEWIADYPLERYPGVRHADGVAALIRTLLESPRPVTLIAIGPLTNVAEALRREPGIAPRTRFVAMAGSLREHHRTNMTGGVEPGQIAEWNIAADIPAAQAAFAAPWREAVITPLDTCAHVVLDGDRYARLMAAGDPLLKAVFENYRIWHTHAPQCFPERQSTVLFDTVAVHLAHTTRHLAMREMKLRVDDRGFTVEDAGTRPFQVAEAWHDLPGFYDELTERLLRGKRPA